MIQAAIARGIRGSSKNAHHYLRLSAEYMDGKPTESVELTVQTHHEAVNAASEKLDTLLNKLASKIAEKADG
jgi:hypothetical protein